MSIHQKIADEMPKLSHLECMACGARSEIGDIAKHLRLGWPQCCGTTMHLITMRQVEEAS